MIKALNITKSYDSLKVLKGIDLTVAKGEIVAIVGPSGAGKSTLLHIVGTLDRPDSGTMEISGINVLGLKDRLTHKPSQLSGGEQQRVAVARALINSPDVILADEPSGNLDSDNAKELHKLFFDLREKFNQTFIIVTHNAEFADMSDRKLLMKDGNFVV